VSVQPERSPRPRGFTGVVIVGAGLATIGFGLAAEAAAFSWREPELWVPDLVVGLSLVGSGLFTWRSRQYPVGGAVLFMATGICWWLGNFSPQLLYLHRAPLVHLLLTYPGWRPRSRLDAVAIAAAYVSAVVPAVWRSDIVTIVLAVALVLVAARGFVVATGSTRHERLLALEASAALGLVLVGGAVARLTFPAGQMVEPALLAYEVVLVAIAVALPLGLRVRRSTAVADLVVELGESRSGTLRARLARELGDPALTVGYWSPDSRSYVDGSGAGVTLPAPESTRAALAVDREDQPFAVVVVDAAVLRDPVLTEAVAAATRLSTSNVELQEEVRVQAASVVASRRRLLVAADEERRQLEARVSDGPQQRLEALAETLATLRGTSPEVDRAQDQLDQTLRELRELARGLHPRDLAERGLPAALAGLAERAPVPTTVDAQIGRLPAELEITLYLICSEALTNVTKYARASSVKVAVAQRADRVTLVVVDDGRGGADPAGGTGLRGLADRVEVLGGILRVASPPGAGTSITAEIPLDGDAQTSP
jgi:signal transduction histidine kinase